MQEALQQLQARGEGEINSGGTFAQSKREEGARVRGAVLSSFTTTETNEQLKDDEKKRKQPGIGTPEPVERKRLLEWELWRKMKSELFEAEKSLLADKELASKLTGSGATQASEWEERQRLRAEELVAIHDTIARFRKGPHGKTPWEREQGLMWAGDSMECGERFFMEEAKERGRPTGVPAPEVDVEKEGLDRKTNHRDLVKAETQPRRSRHHGETRCDRGRKFVVSCTLVLRARGHNPRRSE